jgi:hypothetical protein
MAGLDPAIHVFLAAVEDMVGKGARFAPCPPFSFSVMVWWARHRRAHSRDPISAFTRVFDALWALPTLRIPLL